MSDTVESMDTIFSASGATDDSGEVLSLAKAYSKFCREDMEYRKCMDDPNLANRSYVGMVKRLFNHLEYHGFNPVAYETRGLKITLNQAAPELEVLLRSEGVGLLKQLTHGIVSIGQLAIDPIGRVRFGKRYPQKDNYPLREVTDTWVTMSRVDNLIRMKPSDVDNLLKHSKHTGGEDGRDTAGLHKGGGHLDFQIPSSLSSESVLKFNRGRRRIKISNGG